MLSAGRGFVGISSDYTHWPKLARAAEIDLVMIADINDQ